jgi:hypothetical protein
MQYSAAFGHLLVASNEMISGRSNHGSNASFVFPPLRHIVKASPIFAIAIASILATTPVWLPTYPPMTDLPQHAAQVTLLRNLHDPTFHFSNLFDVNWFTPYLLGYMLIYLIAPVMGIVTACKLVICVSLIALPLTTAVLMKEMKADPYWAILSIPAMYGFSYYWGLLNFIVAIPLGVLFLWALMRYMQQPEKKNLFWIAVLLNLLFFCHALICAFFGLIGICYIFCESSSVNRAVRNCASLGTVIPFALLWLWKTGQRQPIAHKSTEWDLGWFNTVNPYYKSLAEWATPVHPGWGRVSGFVPRLLGVEPRPEYVFLTAILFTIPLFAGFGLSRRPGRWMPLLVSIAVLLFAPSVLWGTAFVFQRFTIFALPFFLIGLEPSQSVRKFSHYNLCRIAAFLIVAAWISAVCVRVLAYDRAADGFEGALAAMEPNERVLAFDFIRDTEVTIAPPFSHFASWYAAEKRGVVDPSSAFWYVELIRYKPGKVPKARLWDFEWNPEKFSWDAYHGDDYRYFLVSDLSDEGSQIFKNAGCPVRLKYASNIWWLYEKDPGCNSKNNVMAIGYHKTSLVTP